MTFVVDDVTAFRYRSARLDRRTGLARFDYSFDGAGDHAFTETVQFALPASDSAVDWERVDAVVDLLGAVLGLSYYKAAAPARLVIEHPALTVGAVDYLARTLRFGLAEFAYRAGLAGFLEPVIETRATAPTRRPVVDLSTAQPLVPIGGGKDSVVSVESLAAAGLSPVQFAVNPNSIIRRVAEVSGWPLVEVTRRIDPLLIALNADGALNGHVPVTAMNSLIGVVQSLLLGLGPVVMSNESSASDPTLLWKGEEVNHQWSKSLEAEEALAAALDDQAGLRGAYFSLLRPFSELRIAQGYAHTSRYDSAIVSCNRAYRMGAGEARWCGDCDKCRFVFLAFAPSMSRERLVGIVGKNMFDDATQLQGYRALLGLDSHKPFECVGEEAECTVAMSMASRDPEWSESVVLRALVAEVPGLPQGDPVLEAQVFAESAAQSLPADYERARHAIV
ncbi:hypothetical protein [Galbitalea soli]|uniref:UDP-N-acetyl-alpha-D-muramoyl-L-alanyl-L-glutamate epimerase n=1 Tax=Galbitalea soli TaxID=1268042 RepID=A0A7C9PLX8_9MICO|nr:hypothetical protein [Galbitalea soli]NEM90552.1 hypothetical protein [Galbitalea soli]NYJ31267.1 hypothetical protein [Galbitalea soli]